MTAEKSPSRFGIASSSCSVRVSQSAESSILAVAVAERRSEWVERPEPNSKALLAGGSKAATSSRNRQLVAGRIQAGTSASARDCRLYCWTRRSSCASSAGFVAAGLDSAITLQNSFQHFDTHFQSRLVFEQSNHSEPTELQQVPDEEERPEIKTRDGIKMFVEMDPRPVKVQDARGAAALAPGALVLHAITEIDPDATTRLAQAQT